MSYISWGVGPPPPVLLLDATELAAVEDTEEATLDAALDGLTDEDDPPSLVPPVPTAMVRVPPTP